MICQLYKCSWAKMSGESDLLVFLNSGMREMRKRAAVSEEPDKSALFRKAALDYHTGLFPTSAAAMIANNLHTSYRYISFLSMCGAQSQEERGREQAHELELHVPPRTPNNVCRRSS